MAINLTEIWEGKLLTPQLEYIIQKFPENFEEVAV